MDGNPLKEMTLPVHATGYWISLLYTLSLFFGNSLVLPYFNEL